MEAIDVHHPARRNSPDEEPYAHHHIFYHTHCRHNYYNYHYYGKDTANAYRNDRCNGDSGQGSERQDAQGDHGDGKGQDDKDQGDKDQSDAGEDEKGGHDNRGSNVTATANQHFYYHHHYHNNFHCFNHHFHNKDRPRELTDDHGSLGNDNISNDHDGQVDATKDGSVTGDTASYDADHARGETNDGVGHDQDKDKGDGARGDNGGITTDQRTFHYTHRRHYYINYYHNYSEDHTYTRHTS